MFLTPDRQAWYYIDYWSWRPGRTPRSQCPQALRSGAIFFPLKPVAGEPPMYEEEVNPVSCAQSLIRLALATLDKLKPGDEQAFTLTRGIHAQLTIALESLDMAHLVQEARPHDN